MDYKTTDLAILLTLAFSLTTIVANIIATKRKIISINHIVWSFTLAIHTGLFMSQRAFLSNIIHIDTIWINLWAISIMLHSQLVLVVYSIYRLSGSKT